MSHYEESLNAYVLGDRMGDKDRILAQEVRLSADQRHYPACGAVLWSDGREMVVDDGDAHTLIVSGTGGGKTELYAYFILAALLLLVSELALANRTAL